MKLIIAGSRPPKGSPLEEAAYEDHIRKLLIKHLNFFNYRLIAEVVSGTARGGDMAGEDWATPHEIPIKRFKPDWARFGNSAGHIRNAEMADYADAAVVLWDGESRGSAGMINEMTKRGKPCFVIITKEIR